MRRLSAITLALALFASGAASAQGVIPGGNAGAQPGGAAGGDLGSTFPNPSVLRLNGVPLATYFAAPPPIGLTTPAAAKHTTLVLTGHLTTDVTGGGVQCLEADNTGLVSGTSAPCGGGGGSGTVTSIATNNGLTGGPISTTGTIGLAAIAADSTLANWTGGSAPPTEHAYPPCTGAGCALQYTPGSGLAANSAIDAATLGGATFAAPGAIGGSVASAGAFTTIVASGALSGAGFAALIAPLAPINSPSFTGAPTAPTPSAGDSSTKIATTAFLAAPGPIGNATASSGAFTSLTASGSVSGAGIAALFSSPAAIGTGAPNAGHFSTLSASGAVSGAGFTTYLASPPSIGASTPAPGAFTALSASGAITGAGFSAYLASPPAIGLTAPAAGKFTTMVLTGNLTTDIIGSTQCLQVNSSGVVSGAGSVCGAGGGGTVSTTGSPASGELTKFSGATTITNADLTGDVTTSGGLATTVVKIGGVNVGTFATQNFATPPAIGATTPAAGSFSAFTDTGAHIEATRIVTAAGAITVSASDFAICVEKTVGAATIVNLEASPATGKYHLIKDCKGDAVSNPITLTPAAGTIDGGANVVLNGNRAAALIRYDGAQWDVDAAYPGVSPNNVPEGGTGNVSLTVHGVLIGEATSAIAVTGAGAAGQVLTSGGAGADPSFQQPASPVATGSPPTPSGTCAVNTQLGGNQAGSLRANGACVAGTIILTFAKTQANGYACFASDLTTKSDAIQQTAYTTTTATLSAAMVASDLVAFSCTGF